MVNNQSKARQSVDQVRENASVAQQAIKGAGVNLIGRITGQLLRFLFQVFLARTLGSFSYGLFVLGNSIMQMLQRLSTLGLENGIIRYATSYLSLGSVPKLKGVIFVSMSSASVFSVLVSVIVFMFSEQICDAVFGSAELVPILRGFVFCVPFISVVIMVGCVARVFRIYHMEVAIQDFCRPLFSLFAVVIALACGMGVLGAVYGFLFASIIVAVLGLVIMFRFMPVNWFGVKGIYKVNGLFFYSMVVMFIGFCQTSIQNLDRLMLGGMSVVGQVGVYNVAAIGATQIQVVWQAFNAVTSPIIVDLYTRGNVNQLGVIIQNIVKWTLSITFPVFIIVFLFSENVMSVFGKNYVVGSHIFCVLLIARLVVASVGPVGMLLTLTGNERVELFNLLGVLFLNIILNVMFIPEYGALGAALATATSLVLINSIRVLEVYFLYGYNLYAKTIYKPIVAGILCWGCGWLWIRVLGIPSHFGVWIIVIAMILLLYFIVLVVLGFDQEDKLIYDLVKRKFFGSADNGA